MANTGRPSVRPRAATTLGALSLASFLAVFADSAVGVALPSIARDLGLGASELAWTLNAYTLGLATVILLAGKIVDRRGARPALLAGLALFTVASVPAALAGGGGVLIVARALQGVGAGLVAPASLAVIGALFSPGRRGVAIGVWAGASAIGLGAGPLLGAVIVASVGWSGVFLVNVPLGLVLVLLVASLSGEAAWTPARPDAGRLDVAGAIAAAAALGLALLALTRGGAGGWLSLPVLSLWLGAAASAAAFVVIEARAADPVAPLEAFRSRQLVGAMTAGLLSTAAMCSLFVFVSLYLQSVSGYGVLATGAVFLPMTAVVAAGSPLAGLAASRVSACTLSGVGMALLSLAMLFLAGLDEGLGRAGIVLGLAVAGLGVAMTATPLTATALAELPDSRRGLAAALVSAARTIGLALGVAVMGAILGDARGAELTARLSFGLEVNAAIAAVGALVAVALLRPSSRGERRPDLVALVGRGAAS